MRKGCEVLEKCEDMVGKLGLFSSNETKDDISTANLKYILVIYYLMFVISALFGCLESWKWKWGLLIRFKLVNIKEKNEFWMKN